MDKIYKMLIINPGSTSTKIAIYENTASVFEKKLSHGTDEINAYSKIADQFGFRKNVIMDAINEAGIDMASVDAVVSRGGLTRPIESGVYEINDVMLQELRSGNFGEHASNLGPMLAFDIAKQCNIPCYTADPVVVDELQDMARLSGIPQVERGSIFHALNQKAVSRRAAKAMGKKYEDYNFVVAHLGGGISVAAHKNGKCIDVNNALGGEGPYSPERAGGLPVFPVVDMCFSGEYKKEEIKKLLVGKGGLTAYLGTNDGLEIDEMIKSGDKNAEKVFSAMGYQVAKEIGAVATVLCGKVDGIILTGGLAYNKSLVEYIENMVKYICPVVVYPGEDELLALAESGLRVLAGEEKAKILKED